MAAVAFGGVRRYAAVRLSPLVVVRQAAEGGEYTEMAFIQYSIFDFPFFFTKGTWDRKRKKRE
jgi:hypothetical protein